MPRSLAKVTDIRGSLQIYKCDTITARRYYRRVFPAKYLGTFKSDSASAEYVEYAQAIGHPEYTKPATIYLREETPYHYHATLTVEGTPTPLKDFVFELGKTRLITIHGEEVNHSIVFTSHPVHVIHEYFVGKGTVLPVSKEFTSTGLIVTYQYNGRCATRTFVRAVSTLPVLSSGSLRPV